MGTTGGIIKGLAIGAGLMYLLDPDRGKRRRAIVKDKLVHGVHEAERALDVARRDLQNRARGIAAEAKHVIRSESVNEEIIVARVRSALGRIVARPGSIDVRCDRGRVELSGTIDHTELSDCLAHVRAVRGVDEVVNNLQAIDIPEDERRASEPEQAQAMRPGSRLLLGVGGLLLAAIGRRRHGVTGSAMSLAGYSAMVRAATGLGMSKLTGIGAGTDAIELHKTVNVSVPPKEAFALWRNVESFPRFMSHVRTVEDLGNGRSRWIVTGPGGIVAEWIAAITREIQDRLIEWKSEEGSSIQNEGRVQFLPNRTGGTSIEIQLRYNPIAGALGHAVAGFFRSNARQVLNADMVRLRSLLEDGRSRVNGHQVTREEVQPANGR